MIKDFRSFRGKILLLIMAITLFINPLISYGTQNGEENNLDFGHLELGIDKKPNLEKIDLELQNVMEKLDNEYIEVIVYLKEQVDTEYIANRVTNNLDYNATNYQKKMAARYAVVDSLRDTADITQKGLIKYLEQEQKKGKVEDFKSFFILNAVYIKADKEIIENISLMNEVETILPDRKIEIDWPEISEEKLNLDSNQDIEWNIERVKAPIVWNEYGINGNGVVVGIIDSGVHWEHNALKEKWRGYNPQNPDNPNAVGNWFDALYGKPMPYDESTVPHGSHCLGTILGQEADGSNKIGVAPGAKWIAAKAFNPYGGQDSWLMAAGEWMLAPDGNPDLAPDIISNSWSGGPSDNEWYRLMVQRWRSAGILPVFAAGNTNDGPSKPGDINNPASYPESLAVGAVDINNKRGSFSRQGPTFDGRIKPDISAPGVNIRSSVPGGYEGGWNGTSMATPHIAGVGALVLSANLGLGVDELEEILIENTVTLVDEQYNEVPNNGYGHGLINAYDAVSSVSRGKGIIKGQVLIEGNDTEAPTINHVPVADGFEGFEIPIRATVTDNNSLVKVELLVEQEYNEFVNIPMEQKTGDHKGGLYEGIIPAEYIVSPGLSYKIKATDFSNNIEETESYYVELKFGIKPDEYSTDFSEYPVGWNFDGDWEWGKPKDEPIPYKGDKLVGTKLLGKHSSDTISNLITPPIDLRDGNLEEAWLRLYHWYDIEDSPIVLHDVGRIFISDDNKETWTQVGKDYFGKDKTWRELAIDLTPYIGSQNPVLVRFEFTADSVIEYLGWYLDNVKLISKDTEAPSPPTGLTGEDTSTGISLEWEPSLEGDFKEYRIYRSLVSGSGYSQIGTTKLNNYLDSTAEGNKEHYYVVTAVDFSGNESRYSNEISVFKEDTRIIYSSDFEEDDGGWTSGGNNNSWEWGEPTSGPNGAYTGTKVWATNLSGDYNSNSACWIQSPEMQIPETGEAMLNFYHWYEFEQYTASDRGYVQVSKDGGTTWADLTIPGQYAKFYSRWNKEWTPSGDLSLADYAGENIKIRFYLISDDRSEKSGWYINNVSVSMKENEVTNQLAVTDINGLPLQATVTIVETNTTVKTNPVDGSYKIIHPSTEEGKYWTIRVESYGYYTAERKIILNDDEEKVENFVLEPIPITSMRGKVVYSETKEPISDARIMVLEDRNIPYAITNDKGEFEIPNILQGEYTLRISSPEYRQQNVKVNVLANKDNYKLIELNEFEGYEEEIYYDDGTDENARALRDAGNGWAMRMTPEGLVRVRKAKIKLYGHDWPEPGGDKFKVAIFDSDHSGEPANIIGEPIDVVGNRGEWNEIDLSSIDFYTDKDFYIVMIQEFGGMNSPGICTDESGSFADRSYAYVAGGFTKLDSEFGNMMIRAIVDHVIDPPTEPEIPEITNIEPSEDIELEEGQELEVSFNGPRGGEGHFKLSLQLGRDLAGSGMKIVEDEETPGLYKGTWIVPEGLIAENLIIDLVFTSAEGITVTDTAQGRVTIVGKEVEPEPEPEIPILTNIEPSENKVLEEGEILEVSFEAPRGGEAYFKLSLPLSIASKDSEIPMEEDAENSGLYKGYWTVPEDLIAKNLLVDLVFTSAEGITITDTAPGRVTIVGREDQVDPVDGEPMENLPANTVIVGDEAFDIRYLNNNEEAQLKLIEWYSQGKEIYIKLSHTLIVNIRGVEVDMEELPEKLTYYDRNGNTIIYIRS